MFGLFGRKDKYEKDALAAIQQRAMKAAPAVAAKVMKTPPAESAENQREQAIRHMQSQVAPMVTPERQALLKNAMAVCQAKRKILDDLDDESRAKLVAMAITTMLNQGDSEPPKHRKK